jgi:CRISPR-associated protein Cmr5
MTNQSSNRTDISRQRSLEQQRAAVAWESIKSVKGQNYEKKYKPIACGSATDIQVSGLGQTLAFWRAKNKDEHKAIYGHFSGWIKERLSLNAQVDLLEWIVNTASTNDYRRARAEAIAYVRWLKRFAEATLEGEIQGKGE